MVEINKRKTEFGYFFEITTNEGTFDIFYGGNLDLYWRCRYTGSILKCADSKSFLITKENYFLFQLFEALYHNIKDYNIYHDYDFTVEEICQDSNQELIRYHSYQHDLLFKDGKIEWHCDESSYEESSIFKIEPEQDSYKLTFKKGKVDDFFTFAIRIRNSGSRYQPFNVSFMEMYQQLCEYDPSYHQIHMEEYLYQKKLIKKKETI